MKHLQAAIITSLLCCALVGCNLLGTALPGTGIPGADQKAVAPTIQTSGVELLRYPDPRALAAYYCPMVIDNPMMRLGCGVALGQPPAMSQLVFEFGIGITAKNPNNIPIPALDVLLAMTLFPGQDSEGLGAICVSLCGQNEPSCTGQPKPGACSSTQNDIRRIEDFAARVPGLISDVLTGRAQEEIRKSTIAAGGDLSLNLTFTMGVEQALRVLQKLMNKFVQDMMQGKANELEIPIQAQGTVFVQLPVVGRLGVGWGPLNTAWKIPVKMPAR